MGYVLLEIHTKIESREILMINIFYLSFLDRNTCTNAPEIPHPLLLLRAYARNSTLVRVVLGRLNVSQEGERILFEHIILNIILCEKLLASPMV